MTKYICHGCGKIYDDEVQLTMKQSDSLAGVFLSSFCFFISLGIIKSFENNPTVKSIGFSMGAISGVLIIIFLFAFFFPSDDKKIVKRLE